MTRHDPNHAIYVISVFAELAGVHPQTLRNYEKVGLLRPQRTSGGSRRFSEADLSLLLKIQDLTNAGVNLEGVKRIIDLEAAIEELKSKIDELTTNASAQATRLHKHYRRDLVPVSSISIMLRTKA